tara:strand:- start:1441 stop:1734 length:294 start_codon:yes stop_codon:yes gene_type:complete
VHKGAFGAGRVPHDNNLANERKLTSMKLTQAETSLIQFLRKEGRKSISVTQTSGRGNSIRAAIRSGRSKAAVRRQFKLTDYEYRGHKAAVTRMSNGN